MGRVRKGERKRYREGMERVREEGGGLRETLTITFGERERGVGEGP